ncbi:ferritin-like domain-containing protein [Mesonia sp. K7]|uniref:ferritin-like domain-containing protein n=1 Tax=Mesonia sp. K7 TaxID=2218606 RepID=UPI000DAA7EC3|nr:ferritin-like domain-containing protein [Mesonia sp. K7]PZD78997.1 ferritin-like domain-containing protein [Mesonia sp. K7]
MRNKKIKVEPAAVGKGNSRRKFLKLSGLAVAGTGLLLSCSSDDDGGNPNPDVFDLGGGDLGVLNYAYALEQLEAEFYTRVVNGSYWSSAATEEKNILEDLYNHEVNHREFFKAALNANFSADVVLPAQLEFDFSSVDFNNRNSVLQTAMVLEDTGVKAYNGAGKIIETAAYLVIAGKIVSVEARHAAAIRSIIGGDMDDFKLFSGDDIVDANGLDGAENPSVIIQAAGGFIVTPFTANQLP